jgi:hypothetical protein
MIGAGQEWRGEIDRHLESSQLILLLISPEFLNSDYCYDHEMKRALERHEAGDARVIPIILRPVDWQGAPIGKLQALPKNGRPLSSWRDKGQGFASVARGIRQVVEDLLLESKPFEENRPKSPPVPKVRVAPSAENRPAISAPDPAKWSNPYDFIGAATREMFKGRDNEIEELLDSIASGTHTAVFGLQRIGKTSLVEGVIEDRLGCIPGLKEQILFAKVDFQCLGNEYPTYKDVFHAMVTAISDELQKLGVTRRGVNLRSAVDEFFNAGRYDRGNRAQIFSEFTRVLGMTAEAARRRIVLFLDEFSEVRKVIERHEYLTARNPGRNVVIHPHEMLVDVPFMQYLSSLLKEKTLKGRVNFIFAVRPYMAEYDERRSLQILKLTKPISLYYLDEAAALALITEPLQGRVVYEPGAMDYLYRLTAGHPYLIQLILQMVVDRIRKEGRAQIRREDIQSIEDRMISESPAFDAHFKVIDSDCSMDEVLDVDRANWGKGTLALIAKIGSAQERGWVRNETICDEPAVRGIPPQQATAILSHFVRAKILEEQYPDGDLQFRMAIPLLRKRYLKQNMFEKYFLNTRKR